MQYTFEVNKISANNHEFYVVKSKVLPCCVAQGETVDEAVNLFNEVEADWIETANNMGIIIPDEHITKEL